MLDNAVLERIAGIVTAADFSESIHAHVFATAERMRANGEYRQTTEQTG